MSASALVMMVLCMGGYLGAFVVCANKASKNID